MIETYIQDILILNNTNHLREYELDSTLKSRDSSVIYENFIPDAL